MQFDKCLSNALKPQTRLVLIVFSDVGPFIDLYFPRKFFFCDRDTLKISLKLFGSDSQHRRKTRRNYSNSIIHILKIYLLKLQDVFHLQVVEMLNLF